MTGAIVDLTPAYVDTITDPTELEAYAAKVKLKQTVGPMPREVPCPRCGTQIGAGCRSPHGLPDVTHRERWKAVGVTRPVGRDSARDYWDGQRRAVKALSATLSTSGASK